MSYYASTDPRAAAAEERARTAYAAWRAKDPAVAAEGIGEEITAAKATFASVEFNMRRVSAHLKGLRSGDPKEASLRAELSSYRSELRHRRRFIAHLEARQAEQKRAAGAAEPARRDPSPRIEAQQSAPIGRATLAEDEAEYNAGFQKGADDARQRALAVMASEHFTGRAPQAAKLLGNLKLSADEIIAMLADMPDQSGAEMLAAIRSQKNPDLGTGGGDAYGERSPNVAAMWKRAQAQAAAMQS